MRAFSHYPRVPFSCGLPSVKMNIPGRAGVEASERGSPKGPLPSANLDMLSRPRQLSNGGSGRGYDDWSNTLVACGGLVEQLIPPYPQQQALGNSLTLSALREHCHRCNLPTLFLWPRPNITPPLPSAVPNDISTSKPSFRV